MCLFNSLSSVLLSSGGLYNLTAVWTLMQTQNKWTTPLTSSVAFDQFGPVGGHILPGEISSFRRENKTPRKSNDSSSSLSGRFKEENTAGRASFSPWRSICLPPKTHSQQRERERERERERHSGYNQTCLLASVLFMCSFVSLHVAQSEWFYMFMELVLDC